MSYAQTGGGSKRAGACYEQTGVRYKQIGARCKPKLVALWAGLNAFAASMGVFSRIARDLLMIAMGFGLSFDS